MEKYIIINEAINTPGIWELIAPWNKLTDLESADVLALNGYEYRLVGRTSWNPEHFKFWGDPIQGRQEVDDLLVKRTGWQ